ncbi:acyl carrier protein [Chryseobacterium phocaeense]|nr:acyl carrier protein [Chryseobacterium phocaeense]
MSEILEVDQVNVQDKLTGFEAWDSLATLSIIAMADEEYGVSLVNQEITDAETVEGLYNLILSKQNA